MALARSCTSTIVGIDAVPISVEVQLSQREKSSYLVIGLADNAVKESRERVLGALATAGFKPPSNVVVNLAPADLKKEGSAFDLPIAVAILAAMGEVPLDAVRDRVFHGELALAGELRAVKGALALAVHAHQSGASEMVLPPVNAPEARLIEGLSVVAPRRLIEVVHLLREGLLPAEEATIPVATTESQRSTTLSLDDVWGQPLAKRALIVGAAGGHNLLMIGPPGCGKSMLAERLSALLPPLTREEVLEVVRIHSIAGLPVQSYLRGVRPFRSPHYIVSDVGLLGGGAYPRPGEISLAHCGVLFLDELPEFRRSAIEALRTPLESGSIAIARAKGSVRLPARFQLIAAMNPCPCGKLGSPEGSCRCPLTAVHSYLRKLSQPILDRIDLHVELSAVPLSAIAGRDGPPRGVSHQQAQEQIAIAQQLQRQRNGGILNAHLNAEQTRRLATVSSKGMQLLERGSERLGLSARGFMRLLKVSLTLADLAQESTVTEQHIAEALSFRSLERLQRYVEGR